MRNIDNFRRALHNGLEYRDPFFLNFDKMGPHETDLWNYHETNLGLHDGIAYHLERFDII